MILSEEVHRRDANIDNTQDKLLSRRIKVEVYVKDLMIRNSIIGHSQEIDLSLRKLENASVMAKKVI